MSLWTQLSGVIFPVARSTVICARTTGMTLRRVPLFSWTMLVASFVWLSTLPVLFANLATLLGLFGTIVGLIGAFAAVATAAPSEKSALLSLSISEAMSCTATGLLTAMPMLTFSMLLNTKASRIVAGLEIAALKTINMIVRAGATARISHFQDYAEKKAS